MWERSKEWKKIQQQRTNTHRSATQTHAQLVGSGIFAWRFAFVALYNLKFEQKIYSAVKLFVIYLVNFRFFSQKKNAAFFSTEFTRKWQFGWAKKVHVIKKSFFSCWCCCIDVNWSRMTTTGYDLSYQFGNVSVCVKRERQKCCGFW